MPMYDFSCEACEKTTEIMCSHADIPKPVICEHCGSNKTFRQYGISMIKSSYDQNGREAVRVNFGGKSSYRSMTRENYERTGDNTSQYTKGYKEHMRKKGVVV
jgi:putative FmdB family regulatory protein